MDVSLGLISKLVKTKSVQRALAPIASNVSLLIILTEQNTVTDNGEPKAQVLSSEKSNVTIYASQMAASITHFISLGERETRGSTDDLFKEQMLSACETLELAKSDLYVRSQRCQADPDMTSGLRRSMCQAAKDVLQGVLKVLIVLDDRDIRHIISLVTNAEVAVIAVGQVTEAHQLVPRFKLLTEAVLRLKQKLDVRGSDLANECTCTQLLVAVSFLRKSVPSLSMATQTALKYRSNMGAQASKESVVQEMLDCLRKINTLLLKGAGEGGEEGGNSFVQVVDQVMDYLSEDERSSLHPDVESVLVSLVRHSMLVAHYHWGHYRELIVASCHRILQAKFRLLELESAMKGNFYQPDIKVEQDNICETILDEVCDLEKHVNMTLMQLIVDTFMTSTQPLDDLVKAALSFKTQARSFSLHHQSQIEAFTVHADTVCQIAQLVAASSTDLNRVKEISSSVQTLETLTPDLLTSLVGVTSDPVDGGQAKLLRVMVKRWHLEMGIVLRTIDAMADPQVFLDMTETRLSRHCEALTKPLSSLSVSKVNTCTSRGLQLSHRALQVAERILDSHFDPIYRDGLAVFTRKLNDALNLARASANDFLTKPESSKLLDTLRRRFALLQSAVTELRKGLDARNHPHLLCDARKQGSHAGRMFERSKQNNITKAISDKASKDTKDTQNVKQENIDKADQETEGANKLKDDIFVNGIKQMSLGQRSSGVGNVQSWPVGFVQGDSEEDASEVKLLTKRLVSACRLKDKVSTDDLAGQVLGWTNHVVEAGGLVKAHCGGAMAKASELTTLMAEIDRETPEVIQTAKFAVSGDEEALVKLTSDVDVWAVKLDRAKVIIDVAADMWLTLTSALCQAVTSNDGIQLKAMTSSITRAQQEMCQILLKTRFLSGSFLPNGRQMLDEFSEQIMDIESLTVTITTTVDVATISVTRTASDLWQLLQVCRDWSVMMTCVVADLDLISTSMEKVGGQAFPQLHSHSKVKDQGVKDARLADALQGETNTLLELVDCVVCGDDSLRKRSDHMVSELNKAMEEVMMVARQPVLLPDIPQYAVFCRLRIGLARSRWTEKAVEVRDLIRQNCRQYSAPIRELLNTVREVATTEANPESPKRSADALIRGFLETSSQLKQKSLAVVQACTDMPLRTVIRSTLDHVAKLTTRITAMLKQLGESEVDESQTDSLADHWGSRVHKLMVNLRRVGEIRPGLVAEIDRIAKGGLLQLNKDNHCPSNQNHTPSRTFVPHQYMMQARVASLQSAAMSDSSPSSNAIPDVLRDAKFLDFFLHKWMEGQRLRGGSEDDDTFRSKVIQAALDIADLCSNMALFTKGGGTFKQPSSVTEAAVSITHNAHTLIKFGDILCKLTLDPRLASNAEICNHQLSGCTSQLNIITTVLSNSANSHEGNRMLARNASSLLHCVRQLFTTAEAVSVKGLKESTDKDHMTLEVMSLIELCRHGNEMYIQREREDNPLDDLGLRRVELHRPPSLAALADFD